MSMTGLKQQFISITIITKDRNQRTKTKNKETRFKLEKITT